MKVKFVDLPRQNKILQKKLLSAIKDVVLEADFNMGPRLERFEKEFARYCGKKYGIGVNSGTDALLISLMACGVSKNDEVIVPANGYFSIAQVVSNLSAKPVFVDVDPKTYLMDTNSLESLATTKTKAIIPIHMYGQPANMDSIMTIADKHKIKIIEDCSHAHGARYKGKVVPIGDLGAFSLYPGKNLGCFGDGGVIVTNNRKIRDLALRIRNDGSIDKYRHEMLGIKSRLDTLQAGILSVKLPFLNSWNKKRVAHATFYTKLLKDIPEVRTPHALDDGYHVFHLYVIQCERRDLLKKYLESKGIQAQIHYPIPIHLQKPYKKLGYNLRDFPTAEEKAKKILSLPMFPELKESEIRYVCNVINQFYRANR